MLSKSVKAELKQAQQLLVKRQHEDVIEICDRILDEDEKCDRALIMKAIALQRLDRPKDSLNILNPLIKENPYDYMALRACAVAHVSLNQIDLAFNETMSALYGLAQEADDLQTKCEGQAELDREMGRIHRQALDIYRPLRTQINKKSRPELYDRLLELQLDLPDDLLTVPENEVSVRQAVHNLLKSIKPSVLWDHVLNQLISLRSQALQKKLRQISARQKTTVGFTPQRAAEEKIQAIQDSKIEGLLNLHISTEDDDEARRNSEAALLELFDDQIHDCSTSLSIKKSETLENTLHALQEKTRDLADTMALFAPVKPLAFELSWDYDNVDYRDVIRDFQREPEIAKEKKSKARKTKKTQSQKEEEGTKKDEHDNDAKPSEIETSAGTDENSEDIGVPIEKTPESKFVLFERTFPETQLAQVFAFYQTSRKSISVRLKPIIAYSGKSVLGWTLVAKALIEADRYEEAIDAAHSGLRAIKSRENLYGMTRVRDHGTFFHLVLAQAYTHYQQPKNWELAMDNYDVVLMGSLKVSTSENGDEKGDEKQNEKENEKENENGDYQERYEAILGKGTLMALMGKNAEAVTLLETALSMDPNNIQAQSDLSWLYVLRGDRDTGIEGLKKTISISNTSQMNAKIYWRIGYTLWTYPQSEEERESCYEYFVKAIEASTKFAPAYTYLGLFYDELVGDKERAHRCFYKALEIDSNEILAGEKLAEDFAANNQWDLVEAVATTVLSSSKAKSEHNLDWPYRALGISRLNQLQYGDAVKYFQKCLRSVNQDILAWIGLGEAYIYSGRYRSAEKALTRALKLSPENFSAWYVLSLAQREMLQFPESAASLRNAIKYSPQFSLALQWAMADNCLRAASYLTNQSLLVDALVELKTACESILTAFKVKDDDAIEAREQSIFYGTAAEVCLQFHELGYDTLDALPRDLFNIDELGQMFKERMLPTFDITKSMTDLAAEFATEYVCLCKGETKARRVSAHSIAALALQKCKDIDAAAEHYKAAIQIEPRNEEMWNAYGVCLSERNPEVAQHCFVRALSLNGRNSETWLNLGALCLIVKDYELALEAIDRALSLEPDHSRAWIAQALAEQALGTRTNDHIYRTLDYAYHLSENDKLASFAFALKEYETRPERPSPAALGALEKLMAMTTDNRTGQLILGLLLERQGSYEASLQHLLPLEEWAHIARVQLATQDYAGALDSCRKLQESAGPGHFATRVNHLSVVLVSGLAHFYLENLDSAIESFTEALDIVDTTHEDVLRLLVEILCASLDADAQQVAQDQLFESIGEHGATLQVTLLLGALGFINKDEAVMQAAQQELENLITPDLQGEPLAQACHILNLLDPTNKSFQRAVFQWPTDYSLWRRVDRRQALVLAEGQTNNPSQMSRALVEAGGVEASGADKEGDNEADLIGERIRNFQRAVFYEPCSEPAWNALASSLVK